jgi:uncharacterized membrane protein HdeD (DUF308 family)
MITGLIQNWRLVVWRGILAILLGLTSFLWPGFGGLQLVITFGIYAMIDGLIAAGTGLTGSDRPLRLWGFILEGLVGITVGGLALALPGLAPWMPVVLIATWALLTGLLEMMAAIRLRDSIVNDWLLAWGGAISIALGVLAFFQPRPGDSTLIWAMGVYGLSFGMLLMMLGFGLRRKNRRSDRNFLRTT